MEKEPNHFRVPVSDTYRRKTPFTQLYEHMEKVREGTHILGEGLKNYYKGDYRGFSEIASKISNIEHEADIIKTNLRNHLPSSLFMPVDKGTFLRALREQDSILDHMDSLARMLDMRHTKIPKSIQNEFDEHLEIVIKTVEAMEKTVENIMDLVETSFVKKEREQTKELIRIVQNLEQEADEKKYIVTKSIYKIEKKLNPMDVYHLFKNC